MATAYTTRCPYCIYGYTNAAKKAGATEEEIAEAVLRNGRYWHNDDYGHYDDLDFF